MIFGVGVGFGLQAASSTAQTALELAGVPIGIAIIVFSENMAAAIMVSVAETVFTNQLTKDLVRYLPSIDPSVLVPLSFGTRRRRSFTMPLLYAYNFSLRQTFYVAVVEF